MTCSGCPSISPPPLSAFPSDTDTNQLLFLIYFRLSSADTVFSLIPLDHLGCDEQDLLTDDLGP